MPQPSRQQVFKSVVVKATEIPDQELREKIENRMMALDQARMEETQAHIDLKRATAKLLRSRAGREDAEAALAESFGEGDNRVAMDRNWEYFRDAQGTPCAENFLSERDQRNMMRLQKAGMNQQVSQLGDSGAVNNDMFESGGGD